MRIAMTPFALRNWESERTSTRIEELTPDELVAAGNHLLAEGAMLVDGYAPFCKHLFLPNTTSTRCSFAPITDINRDLLKSGYRSRREGELAVLERWFEGVEAPIASYLDVILYSHAQLVEEAAEFPEDQHVPDCEWGIVSVIATLEPKEPPMPPITQLRNALGRSEGGSGRAVDPVAYAASVEFWERHAPVKC